MGTIISKLSAKGFLPKTLVGVWSKLAPTRSKLQLGAWVHVLSLLRYEEVIEKRARETYLSAFNCVIRTMLREKQKLIFTLLSNMPHWEQQMQKSAVATYFCRFYLII